jgi:signal transduction histidine kinase/CheY-like chemotaxis protein
MRGTAAPPTANERILFVKIKTELDIVAARQRARQVAALLGFPIQDQVDLATALSEIARNAFQYAGGGAVDFEINLSAQSQFLWIQVSDHGPGIKDLDAVLGGEESSRTTLGVGLTGARRLVEKFEISSGLGRGTCVRFGKALPISVQSLDMQALARVASQLTQHPTPGVLDEVRQQNRELARTLESLRLREAELEARKLEADRLNLELAETNRGVVALYGELEEKAVELRRASELKSQFLSHVSHEFRTPLNSIMALTHLLLRRTDGELTAEQVKQVTFIRQATSGLVEMVNDLLDLAKVESGKTEVHISPVEASQLLGPVRALMRPLATNDAVSLVFEEPPSLMLDTDEAKVGQILRNLVSNALKFTERGEVRISVRLSENSDSVSFLVSDTGIGIAPEDIRNIFQEFSQVQHSIQTRVKGTGLGLSLSRKLAGLLGGTLEVTSRLGVGSTFVLNLPVREAASSYSQPPVALEPGDGAILIVDDEEASRYVCGQMFRGTSHRIIESDALEAAERARFERPQLIILDLMMPGRTGFEILDELKSDAITKEIPVVIHTSKIITDADLHRLAGRQLAVLPKSGCGRKQALLAIRAALREETLFAAEPEFASPAEPEPENT